jgi:hypothetical protein
MYMQFGECADDTQTVFRVNGSDPNSALRIPKPSMEFLGCRCSYFACDHPVRFVVEVHAFGNGRDGIDYQEAFNKMSSIIDELPDSCRGHRSPLQYAPGCEYAGCLGYCSNDQDPNNPNLCTREFVEKLPDKDNKYEI